MSDTAGTPKQPQAQLIITLTEGGQVELTGPLHLEVLCLGMMEKAKQGLANWNQRQRAAQQEAAQRNSIEVGRADLLRNLRNGH